MVMVENLQIFIGIAKRKTSIAKVILTKGLGIVKLNNQVINSSYSNLFNIYNLIIKPLLILKINSIYDINIFVSGGGSVSQLNAIKLSIAKALIKVNLNYKQVLKQHLLLKNDSRIKERRKYGLKKARKAQQYSKR
jgi:small subunit ribosomal protein S9